MANDLRIRKWSNFIPRHLINAEIRIKKLQLGAILRWRGRRAAKGEPSRPVRSTISVGVSPYPLLGHQISSWIAGYLWAKRLDVPYLGGVIPADTKGLLAIERHQAEPSGRVRRRRAYPVLDERDPHSETALRQQLSRARGTRWTDFRLCRDPDWYDQTVAAPVIRDALSHGYLGETLKALESGPPYIALHVRRGEDIDTSTTGGTGIIRWVEQDYYLNVLDAIRQVPEVRNLPVYVVTVDPLDGFEELLARENVDTRVDGDRDEDLVFLAAARVLVTSPSSFSFTAALASDGAVIARHPWWHHIPDQGRWVRSTTRGEVEADALARGVAASVRAR